MSLIYFRLSCQKITSAVDADNMKSFKQSRVFLLTDLTVMDGRRHAAGNNDVTAEVLLYQVRMKRVGSMWSLISRS